jgi:FlaA1/EpsC-like NDP-sugar epimerase
VGERLFNEWLARSVHGTPAVIIGAGDMGELALRHLKLESGAKRQVIGFLDDDLRKQGGWIHGIRVLGTRALLPYLIAERNIREVFVAMEAPPASLLDFVKRQCEPAGVQWQVTYAPVLTAHDLAV